MTKRLSQKARECQFVKKSHFQIESHTIIQLTLYFSQELKRSFLFYSISIPVSRTYTLNVHMTGVFSADLPLFIYIDLRQENPAEMIEDLSSVSIRCLNQLIHFCSYIH